MTRRPAALALVQPGSVRDAIHVRSLLAATMPEIRRAHRGAARRGRAQRRAAPPVGAWPRQALRASRDRARRAPHRARHASRTQQRGRSQQLAGLAARRVRPRSGLWRAGAGAGRRLEHARQIEAALAATLARLPGPVPAPGDAAAARRRRTPCLIRSPVQGRLRHRRRRDFRRRRPCPRPDLRDRGRGGGDRAGRRPHRSMPAPFRRYGNVVIIDHGRGWTDA